MVHGIPDLDECAERIFLEFTRSRSRRLEWTQRKESQEGKETGTQIAVIGATEPFEEENVQEQEVQRHLEKCRLLFESSGNIRTSDIPFLGLGGGTIVSCLLRGVRGGEPGQVRARIREEVSWRLLSPAPGAAGEEVAPGQVQTEAGLEGGGRGGGGRHGEGQGRGSGPQ